MKMVSIMKDLLLIGCKNVRVRKVKKGKIIFFFVL